MPFKKGHSGLPENYRHSEETKKKIGLANSIALKGIIFTKEHRGRIGEALKGRKTGPLTEEHRKNISRTKKGQPSGKKGKKFPQFSGKNNPAWKGGITPLHIMIRQSFENQQWEKAIFERDNYICQRCGNNTYLNLTAHHYPKLFSQILKDFLHQYNQFSPIKDKETLVRLTISYEPFWDINNGITLCKECHKKEKKWNQKNLE